MNKSMVTGVVVGVAIAAASAVLAGYALRENATSDETVQLASESTAPATGIVAPSATTDSMAAAAQEEECWDETVEHPVEPKDEDRVAGTVIGAVVGGAIGSKVGDSDAATVAGAAGGAYAGNRAQKEVQERKTYTTVERRCKPAQ